MIIRPPNEKHGCNLNISLSEMPYEAKILHRESGLLLRLIQVFFFFFDGLQFCLCLLFV